MDIAALFQPPFLLNHSQGDTVNSSPTSPFPASVFQKDTTRLRVIQKTMELTKFEGASGCWMVVFFSSRTFRPSKYGNVREGGTLQ